jgi:hypothetical protein
MDLKELDRMTYNIATEALTISDISTFVRGRIEALKNLFSRSALETTQGLQSSFVDMKEEGVKLDKSKEKFLKKIEELRYVDLVKQSVFVPPGMTSTYIEYMDGMRDFISLAVESKTAITEFTNFISKLMENPAARKDVSYVANRTRELRRERDQILKVQSDYFGKNSRITQVSYENVVRNNGEWKTVLVTLQQLTDKVMDTNPESVLKEIGVAVELIIPKSRNFRGGAN